MDCNLHICVTAPCQPLQSYYSTPLAGMSQTKTQCIPSSNLHSLRQILSNLKPCTLFMCIDNTDPECAVSSQNKKKRFPPILRTHKFLKLGLVFTSGKVLSLQRHLQLLSYRWRRVERFQFICTTICIQTQ